MLVGLQGGTLGSALDNPVANYIAGDWPGSVGVGGTGDSQYVRMQVGVAPAEEWTEAVVVPPAVREYLDRFHAGAIVARVTVEVALTPEEHVELKVLSRRVEKPVEQVARELLLAGLELDRRDR